MLYICLIEVLYKRHHLSLIALCEVEMPMNIRLPPDINITFCIALSSYDQIAFQVAQCCFPPPASGLGGQASSLSVGTPVYFYIYLRLCDATFL